MTIQFFSGKWNRLPDRFRCCDCGLVHDIQVRKRKGRFEIRAWLANRSTGQARRWMRYHEELVQKATR
jgi:hypothetical protein